MLWQKRSLLDEKDALQLQLLSGRLKKVDLACIMTFPLAFAKILKKFIDVKLSLSGMILYHPHQVGPEYISFSCNFKKGESLGMR